MIAVVAAIEGRLGDPPGQGDLGDLQADDLGRLGIAAVHGLVAVLDAQTADGRQGLAPQIVDELGINVFVAAEHR